MWSLYRKWKIAFTFPLVILAGWLMRGGPDGSLRWQTGIALIVFLAIMYLAEELVWMAQDRGRPCSDCGERVQLKPFRLRLRCPRCGKTLE